MNGNGLNTLNQSSKKPAATTDNKLTVDTKEQSTMNMTSQSSFKSSGSRRLGTPSTTTDDASISTRTTDNLNQNETGMNEAAQCTISSNQWIRLPDFIQIYLDNSGKTDPSEILQDLNDKKIGILNDFLNMWSNQIEQLLTKLAVTNPADGMLGEVYYWRDLSRLLDGLSSELKQSSVEMIVQILVQS